jgi:Fe2+ or Zn2+ uptake regulation protein
LRERRIAAFSTPAADAGDNAPRLRWTVDQRSLDLGVALTEEWRSLARIFDETDTPLSAAEVWRRARALELKASRSHVYHLIKTLLALGVLVVTETTPSVRYATPLALRMILRAPGAQTPLRIEDPRAIEALAAALRRAGQRLEDHDIEIVLVEQSAEAPPDAG